MAPESTADDPVSQKESETSVYKIKIIWFNVMLYTLLHASFFYGLYLFFTAAFWKTALFAFIYGNLGQLGMTAGVHRLWSHRSYKAKWPLKVLLCCFASIAAQGSIYKWSRDHRVHHKFADTDADPQNIKNGFFFAHVGWQMCKKHPDVAKKGKTLFTEDLWVDPIVRFQKRFYYPMYSFFGFFLPTMIPVWCWGETIWNSFFVAGMMRYVFSLHLVFLVNSVAHIYGDKPYDKYIEARDNAFLSFLMIGDGWHNYHHTFPWDYSSSELGYTLNLTKLFIDFMALIGQAYDLKYATFKMVKNKKLKTKDGTK